MEELKRNGYQVYLSAFQRYDTYMHPLTVNQFYERLDQLDPTITDLWGVYNEQSMIAYAEVKKYDDMRHLGIIKFHPEYMKDYPSYALFFALIEHYLTDERIKYISNGTRSLSHDTNIQDFLIQKFNFRKAYCRLNIYYKMPLGFIVKMLYPFRVLFSSIPLKFSKKIYLLFYQEYIKRHS